MKEYLILDGYNVINSWPALKKILDVSLEEARNELIGMMAEYKAYKGNQIIIVFDAYLVKGYARKNDKIKGVEIVFTKEKETADSYIERLIVELTKKRNKVSVVTNDFVEQQMILGSGGSRITVRELVLEYDQIKNKIHKKIESTKKQKETLSDRIDKNILAKLEELRRRG